jgi:hypothetical protein
MINSSYDLDKLIINATTRGYQDVKRYSIDEMTVVFTAGNLAAKFSSDNYQLLAVGDVFEGGRIDWSECEARPQWAEWKILSLDAILEGEFNY